MTTTLAQLSTSAPSTPSKPRGHRRKPTAENWDDDFEFSLPTRASKPPAPSSTPGKGKENTRRTSFDSLADESWDESPPGPSRQRSSPPPPLSLPKLAKGHVAPPRLSPSHSLGLPSPRSTKTPLTASSHLAQPLLPSSEHGQRSRSDSTGQATVTRTKKLIKRHPSTSFLPLSNGSPYSSQTSLSKPNRSSPNLPRSPSSERMPPPPLPAAGILGRARSRSRSKSRIGEVRVSGIPFSPSREQLRSGSGESALSRNNEAEPKRPGFWKRLSGVQARPEPRDGHRRRRSSSVGASADSPLSASPQPPLPPLPNNLRSPSAGSTTSAASSTSTHSTFYSARPPPSSGIASILRRSTSSLSRRSETSLQKSPPSAYYQGSSTSLNASTPPLPISRKASRSDTRTATESSSSLPHSGSFSRGFHLPSPSPQSPYNPRSPPILPHSNSFPIQLANETDTETEAEAEEAGLDETPKRRKKIRPVSAMPAPRKHSASGAGWNGEGWKGSTQAPNSAPRPPNARVPSSPRVVGFTDSAGSPSLAAVASGASGSGFAEKTTSTIRRLSSLSKKHGRRLSGGFKFGTNSSSSSGESGGKGPTARPQLETVVGSPSKPHSTPSPGGHAVRVRDEELERERTLRAAMRGGSVSAPNSVFKPSPQRGEGEGMVAVQEESRKKDEKGRRRQSWNDFVIPREVLEKQRELKEGIGAVKLFAGGVLSLKDLLSTHAELHDQVHTVGSASAISTYDALEREFAQWWEMATVLIEVGSTGQPSSTTTTSHPSPPRSRRVTLASDEAKSLSDGLRNFSTSTTGTRKSSLPDPESPGGSSISALSGGPPKASPPPEKWRASTGRQDLSKRQLEVLRSMLNTPAPRGSPQNSNRFTLPAQAAGQRPSIGSRQASTLSAASSPATNETTRRAGHHPVPSPERLVMSRISPDPGVVSPKSPGLGLKGRRASRAGLAGLRDFLRSLKGSTSRSTLRSPIVPPTPPSIARSSSSMQPPSSPTSPVVEDFEQVFFPTSRSFSALGHHASQQAQAKSRTPSPVKEHAKRPSIRGIFRTGSGNWSELVRSPPPVPPLSTMPARPSMDSQRSVDGLPSGGGKGVGRTASEVDGRGGEGTLQRSPKKARGRANLRAEAEWGAVDPRDEEGTMRPAVRKSRIVGLGLPGDSTSGGISPLESGGGRVQSTPEAETAGSSGGMADRSTSDPQTHHHRTSADDDEVVVALTPENLPVLLEYLRQCEGKLGEWRRRVEAGLDIEEGARTSGGSYMGSRV